MTNVMDCRYSSRYATRRITMKKLSKKAQRKKWADHQREYMAHHPEQKRKKADRTRARRAKARRAKKRAAKLIHLAAIGERSQTGKKVSTR